MTLQFEKLINGTAIWYICLQIVKLTEQLSEAQEEIRKLKGVMSSSEMSSSSHSTSISSFHTMDRNTTRAFHGGEGRISIGGDGGEDELLYMNDYFHIFDWLQSC